MKKFLFAVMVSVFVLSLTACGSSNNAEMYVKDGAFNLTAQEYIDALNEVVEMQNDSRYLSIPDFEKSGDFIEIDSIYCSVKLDTNDEGYLTHIWYSWNGTRRDIGYSIGLYSGMTFELLAPDESDSISDQLDMMNTSSKNYETSATVNGTQVDYEMMSQFNYLNIYPADNAEE